MKNIIIFIVVFVCALATASAYEEYISEDNSLEHAQDIRLLAANESEPEEEEDRNCTKPGIMCKNCKILVNCVLEENGQYEERVIQTCDSNTGETCLRDHCTVTPNPICVKNYVFDCTSTGVFPDPFNCRKFHYCVTKETAANDIEVIEGTVGKTTLLCDPTHSYDPISSYCKFNLTGGCPDDKFPVPICKTSGQSGALSNKSIYYVCVSTEPNKFTPKLYMCRHGKIYDNNKCI